MKQSASADMLSVLKSAPLYTKWIIYCRDIVPEDKAGRCAQE